MTQMSKIREHLEKGRSITPLQALNMCSCFRLASIINRLRSEGMDIITNIQEDYSKQGDVKRYACYHARKVKK